MASWADWRLLEEGVSPPADTGPLGDLPPADGGRLLRLRTDAREGPLLAEDFDELCRTTPTLASSSRSRSVLERDMVPLRSKKLTKDWKFMVPLLPASSRNNSSKLCCPLLESSEPDALSSGSGTCGVDSK
mmetsp:Transcript_98856/g.268483  ORF Transcript_98856/g.268483 Transcript_98856/m.268483 type:complete len:131 (+) Transcript_98856:1048-1440(+)